MIIGMKNFKRIVLVAALSLGLARSVLVAEEGRKPCLNLGDMKSYVEGMAHRLLGHAQKLPTPAVPGVEGGPADSGLPPTDFWNRGYSDSALFPVRSKSRVALLSDGEDSLAARIQSLRNAQRSVRIQALIFTADESGRAIAQLLKEKKAQGLDVRVIVDAFSNIMTSKKELDLATQNMYFDLKQNGIEVEGYEALYLQWLNEISKTDICQPNKRFHDKMWVIDAEDPDNAVAIVGGMNIANEYFRMGTDPGHLWRDQDFLLEGPVVSDVAAAFDRNYADQKKIKASRGLLNTDRYWKLWRKHVVARGGKINFSGQDDPDRAGKVYAVLESASSKTFETMAAKVRFFQSRPRLHETYILQAYENFFNSAKREILVLNAYFIPSERIREALKNAARRGVRVTIVTNSPETNDLPQMAYASRYLDQELLEVNEEPQTQRSGGAIRIAEWNGQNFGEGTLHAKFAVADRQLAIGGSYNLDARSETLNSETVVVFENAQLASALAERIISRDLPKCVFITPQQAAEFHDPQNPPDMANLLLWNGLAGQF